MTKKKSDQAARRQVSIAGESYERVKKISDKSGLPMGKIADHLLQMALDVIERGGTLTINIGDGTIGGKPPVSMAPPQKPRPQVMTQDPSAVREINLRT